MSRTRTRSELLTVLEALKYDKNLSVSQWMQLEKQLLIELPDAPDDTAFDYDGLIEGAYQDDLADFATRARDDADYERQWAVDLHALANGIGLPVVMVAFFVAQVVVALVLG